MREGKEEIRGTQRQSETKDLTGEIIQLRQHVQGEKLTLPEDIAGEAPSCKAKLLRLVSTLSPAKGILLYRYKIL